MVLFGVWSNGVVAFLLLQLIVFVSSETIAPPDDLDPLCNISADRTSGYMDYLGCFNFSCFETVGTSNVTDIDECTSRCKDGNHSSSALSLGYMCSCGNFTCQRKNRMCDSKCGIPCEKSPADGIWSCGGKEFYQVYRSGTFENEASDPPGNKILIIAIVCGGIVVTTCFVCFFVSISERRRKRRHAREQADSSTPTELTSQPQRPQSVSNIYSIAGPSRHHLVNTSNGYSVSELTLSSEDTYDHTTSSDRIQSRRGNRQGSHSLPRGLQPSSAHSMRNPTGMQNVTEDRGKCQGGGSIPEFCCSDRKHGVQCSCRKRRRQGGSGSDQRTPGAYSNRRVGSVKWSDKRSYGADGSVNDSRGRWPREVAREPRKPSVGEAGRGPRRDAHLQKSSKSSKEMSASSKKRSMLALPCERDTVGNNSEGRSNQRPPPRSDDNPPPIIHRVEKPEAVENDDMPGEYYHTLEPGQGEKTVGEMNERQQFSSSEYFVLEPSEYSIEQSDPCSAMKAKGHQGSKDTPTCSGSSDQQYDYAAIPGQSNLRFLPCTCKHRQANRNEVGGDNGMIDNILYDPS
nr:uncharacterized protein LOC129280474 [Lytechinus pictus]